AISARAILSRIDEYLSAAQLGITLASLALGWIGEPAFVKLIAPLLHRLHIHSEALSHTIAIAIAFTIITTLHIIIGEQAPKAFAILRAESVMLAIAVPMRIFYTTFFPLIWVLNSMANATIRAFGVTGWNEHEGHSIEEIKIIFTQARSAGLLSSARSELLQRAMSLSGKSAKYLMVPRNEVIHLDINHTIENNIQKAMDSGRSRFPLVDRELDDVIGFIDIREVLHDRLSNKMSPLKDLATTPFYVPEMMSGERLLAEFRKHHRAMAVVVDEYGGASGIVTATDVITAVMGEIEDEDEHDVVKLPGGAYEVEGNADLEEVSETLNIRLESEDMRSLGGYITQKLGRLPQSGDKIVVQGYRFVVIKTSGPKIVRIRVQAERSSLRDKATKIAPSSAPVKEASESISE
ncbi:HlyC/CorC family transporter, partial [Myxococcota bacterium]|nr:HlyC/CorC family transporter [Myxococcota bacterium]